MFFAQNKQSSIATWSLLPRATGRQPMTRSKFRNKSNSNNINELNRSNIFVMMMMILINFGYFYSLYLFLAVLFLSHLSRIYTFYHAKNIT